MVVKGLHERRDRVARKEIGEEEGYAPGDDERHHSLRCEVECVAAEDVHVED